jgi:hypothetical protein
VAKSTDDFVATWYPRIGKDAAEKLRRSRRAVWLIPLGWLCALSASALIGAGGLLRDVIGSLLAVGAAVCLVLFNTARWPTAAAISEWYGVKRMRALPSMRPEHFDKWRHAKGFRTPDERMADEQSPGANLPESRQSRDPLI